MTDVQATLNVLDLTSSVFGWRAHRLFESRGTAPVREFNAGGMWRGKRPIGQVLEQLGGKPVFVSHGTIYEGSDFVAEHVQFGEGDHLVRALTTSDKTAQKLQAQIGAHLENVPPPVPEDMAFAIVSTMMGPDLRPIGKIGRELKRDNYSADVLKRFDRAVAEMGKDEPFGRLLTFSGEPGTGKTYLVRGLINMIPDATFVVVPPEMARELDGPDMLPLMTELGHRRQLYLILEDADKCLAPRDSSDVSDVRALLGYADGLIGSSCDLRIIATTNASDVEFDEALKRPGRAIDHIHVGALDSDKANALLSSMLEVDSVDERVAFGDNATLAQVYAKAAQLGGGQ